MTQQEAKLILVGYGNVGKTSLVNRLVHDGSPQDEGEITRGIKVTPWTLDNGTILRTWDFGGQDYMHGTHQLFFTERSLYLLVLEGRTMRGEQSDADYWLPIIHSFGGKSPVIVVLNKIDSEPVNIDRTALEDKYRNIRAFVETDCKTSKGIDKLKRLIQEELPAIFRDQEEPPGNWIAVKDEIVSKVNTDIYMSDDDYIGICEDHDIYDSKEQQKLAAWLNQLGIVLHFDDTLLHVLDPSWVMAGIYKILNWPSLKEKTKGVLHKDELSEILKEPGPDDNEKLFPFRPTQRNYLLELMRKFELCFRIGDENQYLIPELLSSDQPQEAQDFKPEECLNFRFEYKEVLPEGLMPRFIVKSRVCSSGLQWRTGVILEWDGNQALIQANPTQKRIDIRIRKTGTQGKHRELLAIIRENFAEIHGSVIKVEEMVPIPKYDDICIPYKELCGLEKHGETKTKKFIDGDIKEIDIKELLDGVDLDEQRVMPEESQQQEHSVQLFYSYSHQDENLRDELADRLKILKRQNLIEEWHDREIRAGEAWNDKIKEKMEEAHVILLLLSSSFMASDFIYEEEIPIAIDSQTNKKAVVIPVLLSELSSSEMEELQKKGILSNQMVPSDARPVYTQERKDRQDRAPIWGQVQDKIAEMIKELSKT